ncbi:unnamed protein product [Vitrella brassicaformis CCMP3155]|uniref:Ammonium transporter AmtB-like domain-containing protein n=2 Tax=Vitrella brassicaformis TaxID=1169539 RepID=A0A0G4GLW7_VITBC|nr:unnamed protein product [Vitrella brassicaformis CCMP3155]|mmetsp:Transcript_18912/g.54237  ORF Transcript_18912/g.54237 Transcript_18912/m.54237 type:complete len:605 (+) Transcript_18912:150-1964(+)|eukprot:CEM31119.1 unnamed protein product [Vitrella brassicaformis CCMP3155]
MQPPPPPLADRMAFRAFDSADVVWVAISSVLVVMMTPGAALFYAGLVHHHCALTMIFQSFSCLALCQIIWYIYGYSLAFSPSAGGLGVIGTFERAFLMGMDENATSTMSNRVPEGMIYIYQLTFASITAALITGTTANRMRFRAFVLFIVLWVTFVYVPVAHWVFNPTGFLHKWGCLDFAGGVAVHVVAGASALAICLFFGPQRSDDQHHSIPLMTLGTTLLLVGWFGFTAGSSLEANASMVVALLNTATAGGLGSMTWVTLDWIFSKHPRLSAFLEGYISGLVVITPAAGYVALWTPFPMCVLGVACSWASSRWTANKLHDQLHVFGIHGVAGAAGSILLAFFASRRVRQGIPDGILLADSATQWASWRLLGLQTLGVVLGGAWALIVTYGILFVIDMCVMRLRLEAEFGSAAELDQIELGETAYGTSATKLVMPSTEGSFVPTQVRWRQCDPPEVAANADLAITPLSDFNTIFAPATRVDKSVGQTTPTSQTPPQQSSPLDSPHFVRSNTPPNSNTRRDTVAGPPGPLVRISAQSKEASHGQPLSHAFMQLGEEGRPAVVKESAQKALSPSLEGIPEHPKETNAGRGGTMGEVVVLSHSTPN